MRRLLIVGLLCSAATLAHADPIELSGKVREVSGGAFGRAQAVLTTDSGERWSLVGRDPSDADELLRLSGLGVTLHGDALVAPSGDDKEGRIVVGRYEIVDVGGGVRPRVGIIAALAFEENARLVFVPEDGKVELLPEGWVAKMRKHVGARAWIVGTAKAGVLRPSRFGILRLASKRTE